MAWPSGPCHPVFSLAENPYSRMTLLQAAWCIPNRRTSLFGIPGQRIPIVAWHYYKQPGVFPTAEPGVFPTAELLYLESLGLGIHLAQNPYRRMTLLQAAWWIPNRRAWCIQFNISTFQHFNISTFQHFNIPLLYIILNISTFQFCVEVQHFNLESST